MRPDIVFRCDASASIGAGHVMRCLSAAEAFSWAGWSCRFCVNPEALTTVPALIASGHDVAIVVPDRLLADAVQDARAIVVDHYGLEAAFEQDLKAAGRRIVVFDDLANRPHACDVLVDPTPGRAAADYAARVPATTDVLLGSDYAMISDRWRQPAVASQLRLASGPPVSRIIVSMGATDPADATGRVLAALKKAKLPAHIDVILGANAPHLNRHASLPDENVTVHIDPSNLPALASQAEIAIGAAGTSSFERALLGLPAILVQVAANQAFVAEAFANTGAGLVAPGNLLDDPKAFGRVVTAFAGNAQQRAAMSQAAAQLTDGLGVRRLVLAVAGDMPTNKGFRIRLRLAKMADREWLLYLQRQPETRRFSINPKIPDERDHAAWLKRTLGNRDQLLAIIDSNGASAGMVRLDRMPGEKPSFEVSIAIAEEHKNAGFASAALKLIRRIVPSADLIATILPENIGSLKLFENAGYRPDGAVRFRNCAA